ncbi:MAG: VWA domain-containing protein [Planctomyces sp.]|nr:VWA domain-containing protein [Planctomyces sp.]
MTKPLPRLVQSVFPRPRGPVHWREPWPLIVFLAAYAALLLGLVLTNQVLFTRPGAFWLLLAAPWIWWMSRNGYSGLSRGRAVWALLVRLSILGIFVALIAEPRAVRTKDTLAVVYAMDVSESIGPNAREGAAQFIARAITERPQGDSVGLVTFGKNAAVEVPARPSFYLEAGQIVFNAKIAPDETNLEQALTLAAALLPEDQRSRIVLVSDGSETTGNLKPVLEDLRTRGIAVDVLPITYSYEKEVWVERLELPQSVKLGESYEASVIISSLKPGQGRLQLHENGVPLGDPLPIEFQAGKNRYDLPLYLRQAGYYEYKATVIVDEGEDELAANNTAVSYIFVEGEGKVLLVTDPIGRDADWQTLRQAIVEGERAVDVVDAYTFPRDPLAMMPYDCVIFCNVPNDAFDAQQLQALHDSIYNQGVGFLMVGGQNSFGPGGYHRTLVEQVLPVDMDISKKKILPKGALAIILHTCEFPEGNTWAKRITKQAIKVLGAQDEVGVLAFEGGRDGWVFKLSPAGDYETLATKVNSAEPGDMPAFSPAMSLGLNGLKASDAAAKHMIIISDGDPQPPPPALIQDFIANQVTFSMVAIFPHGGQEITLMRTLAETTGGRYYFPDDPNQLPSIFIKEAKTLKRTMIQNKTIDVHAGHPSPVLEGIDAAPQLGGYVLSTLKESPLVENVLYTVPADAEEGDMDPVLALWRYGLGTTAAFTSDLSPGWGKQWVSWEKYQAFVKQLMIRISRVRKEGHLRMWSYMSGSEGVIMVEDFHPDEMFLDTVASVTGPGDQQKSITLRQVGPRRYQATFPTWGTGLYQINALGRSGNDREDRINGGFIVSYSPEYLRFTSNREVLSEIISTTKGTELTPAASAEELYGRREPKRSSQPVFDWLIVLLCCLIPMDVGIRRVQLDWTVIKGWLGLGRRHESTATMGSLLKRKQAVGEHLKSRSEKPQTAAQRPASQPPTIPPPGGAAGGQRTAPAKPSPGASKPSADAPPSTTSRLLDLKRKRQEDKDSP